MARPNEADFKRNLLPIMRECIELVKMVLFQKHCHFLAGKDLAQSREFRNMLTGALVNELFGVLNQQEPFASFRAENREMIEAELRGLAVNIPEMRIPLTDALRMQYLCDRMESIDDAHTLKVAEEIGLLIIERDLPIPHIFMDLTRRIGKSLGLIVPPLPGDDASSA